MIWTILGIIVIILLAIYFSKGNNSVWGGLTIGIILGIITTIVLVIMGRGFNWLIIVKISVITTLLGFIAELLGKLSDLMKKI